MTEDPLSDGASLIGRRLAVSDRLVAAERLVLGMATDHHQITEVPSFDPVAAQIVRDPVAMDLAIELLDRVAKPTPERRG